MLENCVLTPEAYKKMWSIHVDDPCKHCMFKSFGCPDKQAISVNGQKFIPIEDDESKLPKCGIYCKNCKGNTAKIEHEILWNCNKSYAIKCPVCKSEFILYKYKVQHQYTGYENMEGKFVQPILYGKKEMNGFTSLMTTADRQTHLYQM